jgi:hypothetical protein
MKCFNHILNILDIKKSPLHNNGLFHALLFFRLAMNLNPQIMTSKLKSLIYLACFICASVVYHQSTSENEQKEIVTNTYDQEADIVINPYKTMEGRTPSN